jgi:hypothetical protein
MAAGLIQVLLSVPSLAREAIEGSRARPSLLIRFILYLLQHHAEVVTAEVATAVDLPIPGGHHLQNVLATDIALERPLLVTGACDT